jgi:hypothetical protein
MAGPVAEHPEVQKAIRRLKNMGLTVRVESPHEKLGIIFITIDSVLKLIRKQIKYPATDIEIDVKNENPFIVIRVRKK